MSTRPRSPLTSSWVRLLISSALLHSILSLSDISFAFTFEFEFEEDTVSILLYYIYRAALSHTWRIWVRDFI